MQKRLFFLTGITATALCAITIIEFNLKNQKQDIILANIEALAVSVEQDRTEFDYNNGAAEKITDTTQSQPTYQVAPDGTKIIETVFVYTETSCYGSGIIACEYDFSADISQRPL